MNEHLKAKLQTLPTKPGSYQMKDKKGRIIYVGKAKNLKNRVNQYFVGAHDYKTTKMVTLIDDFEYVVTNSEKEALLLEINLIKEYRPRFNILMMDDKSYPYLRLTKEKYPTLEVVRDLKKHADARYFGPYPDVTAARNTYDLLQSIFPLRKCKKIPKKVCLYYHMGQCLGPCEFDIDEKMYQEMYQSLIRFLNGDTKEVEKMLIDKRDQASEELKFEEAKKYQDLLMSLNYVTSKQQIEFTNRKNVDVFNYYFDKGFISIQGLLVRNGKLLDRNYEVKPLYEEAQEAFISFILQYYQKHPLPKEVLLPANIDYEALNENLDHKVFIPQRGDYKKLIEMAYDNAKVKLEQQLEAISTHLLKEEKAIDELSELIGGKPANVIEMFDNSHISGTNAVAGLVVYRDGKKDKASYRHYKVSNGADDFANMKEVIYRRYYRLLMEQKDFPDILIVDGGLPQIKAANEVLKSLNITDRLVLLGLVKDDKHRTNSLMNDKGELLNIKPNDELFYLLTNIQDEVHRFAISYHRKLRSKSQLESTLDDIKGIGPVKKKKLIRYFGSFKAIKNATLEELENCLDQTSSKIVYDYFQNINAK